MKIKICPKHLVYVTVACRIKVLKVLMLGANVRKNKQTIIKWRTSLDEQPLCVSLCQQYSKVGIHIFNKKKLFL